MENGDPRASDEMRSLKLREAYQDPGFITKMPFIFSPLHKHLTFHLPRFFFKVSYQRLGSRPVPYITHFSHARTLCGADVACVEIFNNCSIGMQEETVIPSFTPSVNSKIAFFIINYV